MEIENGMNARNICGSNQWDFAIDRMCQGKEDLKTLRLLASELRSVINNLHIDVLLGGRQ